MKPKSTIRLALTTLMLGLSLAQAETVFHIARDSASLASVNLNPSRCSPTSASTPPSLPSTKPSFTSTP